MTAENALIRYESAQNQYPWEEMTNSAGDRKLYEGSAAPWSGRVTFEPDVKPYGLATGGKITVGTANDTVDVAALTAYLPGIAAADDNGLVSVASVAGVAVARAVTNAYKILSITVDNAAAIAVVAGAEGTAFSETRGANGGPPLIPVDSVEIGQVRYNSLTSAAVKSDEIKQVVGLHQERFDFPVWEESPVDGEITFAEALAQIHTGSVAKKVYVKFATPIFASIPRSSDWTPAETTHSLTSTAIYGGAIGSSAASINQASFTAHLTDGISDGFLSLKNQKLWFEFKPDRLKSFPKQLTQGLLGISRTFPASGGITANCTVTPDVATVDVLS